MAIRVNPFLLEPNAITHITNEQVESISKDDWVLEIISNELECDKTEAASVVTEVLYNMKIGEYSEFAEGVNYLAGYILEAACNKLGRAINAGEGMFRDSREQVSELSALIYTQADITGTATKKAALLGLRIDLDWEFPEILFLLNDEIEDFLDEFKDNPYLVALFQELMESMETSELKALVKGYISEDELQDLILQAQNSTVKNRYNTSSERLTYDSTYLQWLLMAKQEDKDLFVFVH